MKFVRVPHEEEESAPLVATTQAVRASLGHGPVLRGKVDGTTLNLAVQKVCIGTKENRGKTKDPCKDNGGLSTRATRRLHERLAGAFQLGKVFIDKGTSRSIGVVNIHVGFATSGAFVGFLANLRRFGIVVPVSIVVATILVLLVSVLFGFAGLFGVFAGKASSVLNHGGRGIGHFKASALVENAGVVTFGNDRASVIPVELELDGLSVLGAVRGHEVLVPVVGVVLVVLVVLVVVVVVLVVVVAVVVVVLNLCRNEKEASREGLIGLVLVRFKKERQTCL